MIFFHIYMFIFNIIVITFPMLSLFFTNAKSARWPGPRYISTKGEVWPETQSQIKKDIYHIFKGFDETFYVMKPHYSCDILEEGIKRVLKGNTERRYSLIEPKQNKYDSLLVHVERVRRASNNNLNKDTKNRMKFDIALTSPCEYYPHLEMDERYKLTVQKNGVELSSASIWGILRGMTTFTQLLYYSEDYSEMRFNLTEIEDYPAYKYRGLLIDTGRHYLKIETINAIIDAMEMNKMNALHWHIVDDESFPYQSEVYPLLSENGAYHSSMVYTKSEIQKIIQRCKLAGIRVIPEFDVPGHVRSWGQTFPNILTQCYEKGKITSLGPLNPINNSTYTVLENLFQEVSEWFPDEYIHLGGDEIDSRCWTSNPNIIDYMRKNKIKNINELKTVFMTKLGTLLPQRTKCMMWQDVFDAGVPLNNEIVLQVWRWEWVREMDMILSAGYPLIFSSAWYLDIVNDTFTTFYLQDPRQMIYEKRKNAAGLDAIIGGEACMWGEMADNTNILSRTWPRASAVAERLWTGLDYKTSVPELTDYTRRRIDEHICRMRSLGIPAEPANGPSFCYK